MDIKEIKAVVFDLGNVIVDLDPSATIKHFRSISNVDFEKQGVSIDDKLFLDYEKGLISSDDFREGLRELMKSNPSDQKIDQAWNAMLVDTPLKRLQFMDSLREKYKVFVLSNTNEIHVNCFEQQVHKNADGGTLSNFCDKIYYSHHMNMRKPDAEIYQSMVADTGLLPQQLLFLDDKQENVTGAKSIGIQAVQVTHPDNIFTII